MRKKSIVILLIYVLLFTMCTGTVFAGEIMPRYTTISGVDCSIAENDGTIAFDVYVRVPSSSALDSAYVDIVMRTTSGVEVATFTGRKMTYSYGSFYYANEVDATVNGTYFFTYEVRCYKNGVLVDNPSGSSSRIIYNA